MSTEAHPVPIPSAPTRSRERVPADGDPKCYRCPAVNWYEPRQLFRTATEVLVSSLFGKHSDRRLIVALTDQGVSQGLLMTPSGAHDYSRETAPFWFDYVSDTGDGWNATYTVAYYASQKRLKLKQCVTERGRVLVFGGDQVYPTPSTLAYQQRLVNPYRAALPPLVQQFENNPSGNAGLDQIPHVYAIPGNHDWYDSLVSFTRLFCARESFAGWLAPQHRSYFALKLPQNWWLIGTDIQLASDIDGPQSEYLRKVLDEIGPNDRVILCVAEPYWISQQLYKDNSFKQKNLAKLERRIGNRIAVYLAGDLHHYRRHENPERVQKITAGGGGAFLHATHGQRVNKLTDGNYELRTAFPPESVSRKLARRNLRFPYFNPWFGVVTGVLYALTAWSATPQFAPLPPKEALLSALDHVMTEPFTFFWVAALITGFYLFTETHRKVWRVVAGSLHAAAHLAMVFILSLVILYGSYVLGLSEMGIVGRVLARLLLLVGIFIGGYLAGPFIMGIYLYVSLNWFNLHHGEASSAMCVEDWKHFLRLKIDTDGSLTIFPIGIRRVAQDFRRAEPKDGTESWFVPNNGDEPQLIEDPITIPSHSWTNRSY